MKPMKRMILLAVLFLLLTGCTRQHATAPEAWLGEGAPVMSEDGSWPENDCTAGLPVPSGEVEWVLPGASGQNLPLCLTGMTDEAFREYLAQLENEGYVVLEMTDEEVEPQGYRAVTAILSGADRSISLAYGAGGVRPGRVNDGIRRALFDCKSSCWVDIELKFCSKYCGRICGVGR